MNQLTRLLCTGLIAPTLPAEPAATTRPNLAPNPSFEQDRKRLGGWLPLGLLPTGEEDRLRCSATRAFTGSRSLEIRPGPFRSDRSVSGLRYFADYNGGEGKRETSSNRGVVGARTIALRLEPNVEFVEAAGWIHAEANQPVTLSLVWTTRRDRRPVIEMHRDTVSEPVANQGQWKRFQIRAPRPASAIQVQLWIETTSTDPVLVDGVELYFDRRPEVRLLINQLGFEPSSEAKCFVLQSTRPLEPQGPARVIDVDTCSRILTVDWVDQGYRPELDYYYWTADFASLTREGNYVVAAGPERRQVVSPRFSIRSNLLETATAQLAYRFYTHQRCGAAVPNVHAACHLDDGRLPDGTWRDLSGGWHDAGDYNKYNGLTPDAVRQLVEVYHRKPDLFARWDEDANAFPDVLDEAAWGTRWLDKMWDEDNLRLLDRVSSGYRYWGSPELETDNRPDSGDERATRTANGDGTHCVAAYAMLGRAMQSTEDRELTALGRRYIAFSEKLYRAIGGDLPTQLALWDATGKEAYRQAARDRARAMLGQSTGTAHFRELAKFALRSSDALPIGAMRKLAEARVRELEDLCPGPFRVAQRNDPEEGWVYCRRYDDVNDWYVGETAYRLDAAIDGLLAARLGIAEGRVIAEHQINWLLGCNPAGVSMMEGVGSAFVPGYHHRYNAIPGNPRGAVPGAILNGFVRAFPHADRPWLDLCPEPNADYHANEPWLLQNNRWLEVLAWW